jgi:serine/threonine protein kinase
MGDLVGRNLGPYRVLEQLGIGGMATVYKAYQPAMDRYVAIKVLPEHLARDATFRARFEREAHTIARLEHRYILPVYDVGEDDSIPYLVMRYVNGGTLSDLMASQPLTIEHATRLVGQVGEALAYAHQLGVIHRDIKPANVLIGRDGDVLLTDFGIAKIVEGTLQLTSEHALIGTPFYMAPEQAQGQAADARSDIYALGIILYEALTGRRPFVAETPMAVVLMHIHSPLPPPRQLNPAIPEALERVILRALAKNPADRFQTADAMVEALHTAAAMLGDHGAATLSADTGQLPSPPTPAPAPARPASTVILNRWSHRAWLIAGASAAAALILVVWLLLPGRLPAPSATSTVSAATAGAQSGTVATALPALGPAALVNAMIALSDTIWAATDGGLVRWSAEGVSRVFTAADGLPFEDSEAIAVVVAPDGTLWVGGGGVAHIRPGADALSDVMYYNKDDGLGTGVVRALMVDADGSIWAGGPQGANRFPLSHFDGKTWRTDELPADDPVLKGVQLNIRSILRSRDGVLWLGLDRDGIVRWDGTSWAHFGVAQSLGQGNSGGDLRIRRLLQDRDGTIWAAASTLGLLRFDAGQGRWQRVVVVADDTPIRGIAQLGDGGLWASGDRLVARSADGGQSWRQVGTADGLGSDIAALVQDSAGRVWAGAYRGGVSILEGDRWRSLQR